MDLNNARQTIETLEKDLLSLRGLAAQLDASKDKVHLELANKDALCQQLGKVTIGYTPHMCFIVLSGIRTRVALISSVHYLILTYVKEANEINGKNVVYVNKKTFNDAKV